jgi:hypothetical protein
MVNKLPPETKDHALNEFAEKTKKEMQEKRAEILKEIRAVKKELMEMQGH